MIKTYFFVPLTNLNFIQNAQTLKVDHIVYDLEDAISDKSKNIALNHIHLIIDKGNCYVRPKIKWNNPDFNEINYLLGQGFQNFVIPKAESLKHIELFFNNFPDKIPDNKFLLLVENPRILFDLTDIIKKFGHNISGLSLGSHDYCNFMGAKYVYESYRFAHDYILNVCKSFDVEAIDIASMNIGNKESFIKEVKCGFDKGYRSKFILHPDQLDYLKKIDYFDDDEVKFAKLVESKINLETDFDAVKVGGRILEKPHISRIKEILKFSNHGIE